MADVKSIESLRRDVAGKSRAEVAADLGISERHLYRLERGITRLSRRWVLRFAAYYGVRPNEIGGKS